MGRGRSTARASPRSPSPPAQSGGASFTDRLTRVHRWGTEESTPATGWLGIGADSPLRTRWRQRRSRAGTRCKETCEPATWNAFRPERGNCIGRWHNVSKRVMPLSGIAILHAVGIGSRTDVLGCCNSRCAGTQIKGGDPRGTYMWPAVAVSQTMNRALLSLVDRRSGWLLERGGRRGRLRRRRDGSTSARSSRTTPERGRSGATTAK